MEHIPFVIFVDGEDLDFTLSSADEPYRLIFSWWQMEVAPHGA
jgi:hypothetical protein